MFPRRRFFSWITRLTLALMAIGAPGAAVWAAAVPAAAAAPPAAYIDNRSDAVAVLNSYVNAISRKEYARAYSYWESGSSVGSFENFEKGFAGTDTVALTTGTVGSSAGAGQLYYVVPVTLNALQTNGTTQTYVGCYTLHLSQPGIQAEPPFRPMGIMSANLKQVIGGANADTLRNQACSEAGYAGTTPISIGATPGAPESGAAAYIDNRSGPLEVVQSLINALNRKEYARAYGYWAPNYAPSAFAQFQQGYSQTQSVTWSFGSVLSDAGAGQFYYQVPVTLKAQTSGGLQTFVGCYTLHLSNPGIQGTPYRPMALRAGSLTQVANDANTGALMQTACTSGVPTPVPATWTRLSFAAGATSGGISGNLNAGEVKEYRVRAGASQLMFVDVTSAKNDVFVEVLGVTGGQALVRLVDRKAHWSGTLPANQDYLIRVVSTSAATPFGLKVTIPRRIVFVSGAVSATVPGTVAAGTTNTYVFRALAGQTVTATATTTSGQPVWVGVYGLGDGKPVAATTAGVSSVTGKLPANQDYLLHIVPSGATSSFSLVLTIR